MLDQSEDVVAAERAVILLQFMCMAVQQGRCADLQTRYPTLGYCNATVTNPGLPW